MGWGCLQPEEDHQTGAHHCTAFLALLYSLHLWGCGEQGNISANHTIKEMDTQRLFCITKVEENKFAAPKLCPVTCPEVLQITLSQRWNRKSLKLNFKMSLGLHNFQLVPIESSRVNYDLGAAEQGSRHGLPHRAVHPCCLRRWCSSHFLQLHVRDPAPRGAVKTGSLPGGPARNKQHPLPAASSCVIDGLAIVKVI